MNVFYMYFLKVLSQLIMLLSPPVKSMHALVFAPNPSLPTLELTALALLLRRPAFCRQMSVVAPLKFTICNKPFRLSSDHVSFHRHIHPHNVKVSVLSFKVVLKTIFHAALPCP